MIPLLAPAPGLPAPPAAREIPRESAPGFLDYEELVRLSDHSHPSPAIREKVERLLHTPFIANHAHAAGVSPRRPAPRPLGPTLRAAFWNIERGSEFEWIRLALGDPDGFTAAANGRQEIDPDKAEEIHGQARLLRDSDLVILNEVDLGMTRSDYRDVAAELADALGMNYAFGVEFIEVDRLELGLETPPVPSDADRGPFLAAMQLDQARYRGLHGSAILSRYPISSARLLRLEPCYDWYHREKREIAALEKGRRLAADTLFLERIGREVRLGNRMALIADLEVPESPTGTVTVAAVHLENKCPPKCRQRQLREVLEDLRRVVNPIVLAGDLNSTGSDSAPTSVGREVAKRVRDPHFWARQAITWFTPVSLPRLFLAPANYYRKYLDPTGRNIPLVAPNKERGLFTLLERFRADDGTRFDFGGDTQRSTGGRTGTLSNSNERALKGFTSTFSFQRDFKGLVGNLRLDWILVKPPPAGGKAPGPRPFEPWFGRTLEALNTAVPDRVSDHHPITVDLPLTAGPHPPEEPAIRPAPSPRPPAE